jgi:hypothetical protein
VVDSGQAGFGRESVKAVIAVGPIDSDIAVMLRPFSCLIAWLTAASPVAALACSPANLNPTKSETIAIAQEAFRSASAVLDAEVVDAGDGEERKVILRPLRVWKGPLQNVFVVKSLSTCDIEYWQKGSRLRLVLSGGPTIYTARQQQNGVQAGDAMVFGRELDRLIGYRRPRGFRQPNTAYVQ